MQHGNSHSQERNEAAGIRWRWVRAVKCPEVGPQTHTRWRKCWVVFFACQCWLDSDHMPGAPAAPPGKSWVLFQSPQVL